MEILLKTFLFDSLETTPEIMDRVVNAWVRESGSMVSHIETSHYTAMEARPQTMLSIMYLPSSSMTDGLPDFDSLLGVENVLDLSNYDTKRPEEPEDQTA